MEVMIDEADDDDIPMDDIHKKNLVGFPCSSEILLEREEREEE
jgi:hypothetical protein